MNKCVHKVEPDWLALPELKAFSDGLLALQGYNPDALLSRDAFVALPHESLMRSKSAVDEWKAALQQLSQKYGYLCIKYHPRDTHEDLLGVKQMVNVTEVPRKVNFESLLPHLNADCVIFGDFSSVLINALWLRPSLSIYAIVGEGNHSSVERFREFYSKLKINLVKLDDIVEL